MNDLSLVVTILRFGFLVLMWIMVFSVVAAMRRDLVIGRKAKVGAPTARQARKHPELIEEAPPAKVQATQLVVTEGPLAGTTLELSGTPILLGRAQEANLVLEDDYASGRHARLFPQGTRWFLEDLGSTNGTAVDGAPVTRALPVGPESVIRIGKTVMRLEA